MIRGMISKTRQATIPLTELEQAAFAEQGADRNQEIFPAIKLLRKILVDNGQPTPGLAD